MRQPLVGHASTYLVELVAQINRVDVIALQIREHDDLSTGFFVSDPDRSSTKHPRVHTKKTIEKRRAAAMKTAKRKSHAVFTSDRWCRQ